MVDAVFVGLSILTIGSAIITLESREILYGGIALAISMLGIAGYFIILDAPFVAVFQIAVYVGAVAVLIIFTVMLVRSPNTVTKRETKKRKIAGILLSLGFLALIGTIVGSSATTQLNFSSTSHVVDIKDIGKKLLTYYSPVLIVLALTLAGSIIGALALARREDIEEKNESA
ncbi:MAG: NADH-quinone oxidoreductase subunit J [Thermoproteota archaeon]|nr:NADH-quinone oxidoreductase subunit J [Thermoproteota archaeon]